eukprot:jgi/Ulvmu1/7306/UM035_0095.1
MGLFLFNLKYQPTLQAASKVSGGALVTACHDDTYLQGRPQDVAAGAALIMGRPCQPQKTSVYCKDTDTAAHVAALLATRAQIAKMTPLPLSPQVKWLVMHNCLQHRESHLLRSTQWRFLEEPLHQVEIALLKGLGDILDVNSLTDAHPRGRDRSGPPFRGDAGVAMRHTLDELHQQWPSIPGLSECPAEPAEWAGLSGGGSAIRMSWLQNAVSRADSNAREALFTSQEADGDCVCGRASPADGSHALVCNAVLRTVVARHDSITQAWRRFIMRAGISTSLEPNIKSLPQYPDVPGARPPAQPPGPARPR